MDHGTIIPLVLWSHILQIVGQNRLWGDTPPGGGTSCRGPTLSGRHYAGLIATSDPCKIPEESSFTLSLPSLRHHLPQLVEEVRSEQSHRSPRIDHDTSNRAVGRLA